MYPRGATEQCVMDMAGNVWEWCVNEYENPDRTEAVVVQYGGLRGVRGGSWINTSFNLRVLYRGWGVASDRSYGIGFRLAQDFP